MMSPYKFTRDSMVSGHSSIDIANVYDEVLLRWYLQKQMLPLKLE